MKVLTAQTAQISTAAVSINTLTVSGKQVTLAVFRQVIEEPIINRKDVSLNGVGWGHVNYLVDRNRRHLLWQSGSELRRCYIDPTDYDSKPSVHDYEATKRWLSAETVHTYLSSCWVFEKPPKDWWYSYNRKDYDRLALLEQLESEYARWSKYHSRMNALLAPLWNLPQLFIAV